MAVEKDYNSQNVFLFAPTSDHEDYWHVRDALEDVIASVEDAVTRPQHPVH